MTKTIQVGFFEKGMFAFLMLTTIVALYLSYYMELMIYRSIFEGMDYVVLNGITITVIFAATFNAAKLGITWILSFLKLTNANLVPAVLLRVVLVVNSLLMTVFIVTGQFTAPHLQEVYNKERTQVESQFYNRETRISENHNSNLEQCKERYTLQVSEIKKQYQPDIALAKTGMNEEMHNVQNGVWKGPYYKEWKLKFDSASQQMNASLSQARLQYQQAIDTENKRYEKKQEELSEANIVALANVKPENYLDRYESQNHYVTALISLINKVTGATIGPQHIILLVAMLLTTIIEFIPLLLGGHLFSRVLEMKRIRADSPTTASEPVTVTTDRTHSNNGARPGQIQELFAR